MPLYESRGWHGSCRRKRSDNLTTGEEGGQIMKVKTNLKAGGTSLNHNETLVRDKAKGLRVKTHLKAGMLSANHNETLVRDTAN
jgi:hypothetical protein